MGLGFLFPGQGSQQPGMGADFLAHQALARHLFEEASDTLGFNLKKLCLEGDEAKLALTFHAQPAILTVSTIAYRLLADRTPATPLAMAGHSLGEYSALVAAGAMSFAETINAVHLRGRFMQDATPVGTGAMAAILGQDDKGLKSLCRDEAQGEVVVAANYNAPGQIVISGHDGAVNRVLARAKGKLLVVSAPFHSPLMEPAKKAMKPVLKAIAFSQATTPVVANASNDFLQQPNEFMPSLLEQITSPVLWDSGIRAMAERGVERVVELGHGKVLSGLMKRIDKSIPAVNVMDEESLKATLEAIGD